MISGSLILRRRAWLAVVLGIAVLPEVHAAFGDFMPLSYSGQIGYNYGYVDNAGTQSESTGLLLGINASGFIWRPWFSTTSLALNIGLARTQTTTSSSEGTTGTGSFSLGVFPRSRFPFSMSYSRSDSRSQQFQDLSQASAENSFQVTRLALRQSYRPRRYNQLYNAWYNSTSFEGGSLATSNTAYGLDYQLRFSHQSLSISTMHSGTKVHGGEGEPTTDVLSLTHVYTPSTDLGVNSLASYVEVDPGGVGGVSIDSQAFSSFFWRPEHRPVSVSGGVRLTESKSDGVADSVTRSLSTNLGLGYRLTRSLNMSAGVSLGTSDNGSTQSLSTTQTVNVSYSGGHYQWQGYSYTWNWAANASNSTTRSETGVLTTSEDRQGVSSGAGHNLGKSWSVGRNASMAATFSQSISGSKSSGSDVVAKTLNNGVSLSWNSRGERGSTYVSTRLNDSRSYGDKDTVYDDFGVNYNVDMAFNRLSSMTGNVNFQANSNESETDTGGTVSSSTQSISGGLGYQHSRPFGIYNMQFSSNLQGSKQIDSPIPSTTLRWEGVFRYSLGLLSTSLSLRASESAGGSLTKSMNFQATRSF